MAFLWRPFLGKEVVAAFTKQSLRMDEKLLELHMEKDFFKRKLAMKMSIEELVNHSDLPIR